MNHLSAVRCASFLGDRPLEYRAGRSRARRRAFVLCLAWLGCAAPALPLADLTASPAVVGQRLQRGAFTVAWEPSPRGPQLRVSRGERVLWESVAGRAFVGAARGVARVAEARGMFRLQDAVQERCLAQSVEDLSTDGEAAVVRGRLRCRASETGYQLRWTPKGEDRLTFELSVDDPQLNRLYLIGSSSEDERFFGFGEQFSHLDLKGHRVPVLVSEQGIGRGAFPLTAAVDLAAGAGGDAFTTYAPVPYYLTSQLRSIYLENTEVSVFDLRDPHRAVIELHGTRLRGAVLAADSPLGLVSAYTAHAGRMRRLPDWVHEGAVVGMQGGTQRVRDKLARLTAAGVPVSALWIQDWQGQRVTSFGEQLWWNWELDLSRYPDWPDLLAELRQRGIRVLTYVNPFLTPVAGLKPGLRRDLFGEAEAAGLLVRRPEGGPYLQRQTSFDAALVDLTNPKAWTWLKSVLRQQVLGAGASGWMADFGEALPFDAQIAGGDPAPLHNRYPELWAQLNREVVEEADGGRDLLVFHRSGFTRSPGLATLFWLGDQTVTWDEHDGLQSAITGLLSGGLSGFALNHSDVGGYTTIVHPVLRRTRSQELLMRWAELAAFTPVLRTHEGNRPGDNHQVYSSGTTAGHFARMAKLYRALGFYRRQLVLEAEEKGHPVVRAMLLHYWQDEQARTLTHQFLLGTELLVAPVTEPGRSRVRVYLPDDGWVHLWTGQVYARGEREVPAPLGSPAVFVRGGSPIAQPLQAALAREGLFSAQPARP